MARPAALLLGCVAVGRVWRAGLPSVEHKAVEPNRAIDFIDDGLLPVLVRPAGVPLDREVVQPVVHLAGPVRIEGRHRIERHEEYACRVGLSSLASRTQVPPMLGFGRRGFWWGGGPATDRLFVRWTGPVDTAALGPSFEGSGLFRGLEAIDPKPVAMTFEPLDQRAMQRFVADPPPNPAARADESLKVGFWHLADVIDGRRNVGFQGKADTDRLYYLLMTRSGHYQSVAVSDCRSEMDWRIVR
jgi:hypothetical protein